MNKKFKMILIVAMMLIGNVTFANTKKSIVCTTFSEYDWVINILGNKISDYEVTLLQNNGTDLHSYQPAIKDIAKISTCDLFIYVGGESDEWVEKVLKDAKNKNLCSINMMDSLGDNVFEEELVEGMQGEEESEDEEEETEYDEHVWLSLKNAIILTNVISSEIIKLDFSNKNIYESNTKNYISKLKKLDEEYKNVISNAKYNTLLFGDRFPFRYMTEDYSLNYFAAFIGCSAESEASFNTISFLSNKVDELDLNAILTIEKSDKKISKTIVANTKKKNQKILELDSLQSITEKEIKKGRNYLSAMQKNLEVLKIALN